VLARRDMDFSLLLIGSVFDRTSPADAFCK
jgi:hypothetical protein